MVVVSQTNFNSQSFPIVTINIEKEVKKKYFTEVIELQKKKNVEERKKIVKEKKIQSRLTIL